MRAFNTLCIQIHETPVSDLSVPNDNLRSSIHVTKISITLEGSLPTGILLHDGGACISVNTVHNQRAVNDSVSSHM